MFLGYSGFFLTKIMFFFIKITQKIITPFLISELG